MPSIAILALPLAVAVAALVYRDERLGAALLVGATVIAAVYVLLGPDPAQDGTPQPSGPASTSAYTEP